MSGNTVMGHPERVFREAWISVIWKAMTATGRGYRRHSLRHTGRGEDRRKDKAGTTKLSRRLALCASPALSAFPSA